jgi:hypothetical protein
MHCLEIGQIQTYNHLLQDVLRTSMCFAIAHTCFQHQQRAKRLYVLSRLTGHSSPYAR